jgi:glycosyltransferase involved in cell wall biosynthesis
MPHKLLIIGDPDSATSGLARIKRDVAKRIYSDLSDVFTVATAGCGEVGDFPWKQFQLHDIGDWMIKELPYVAQKFAGDEELIIFFLWDASRLGWFANPDTCPDPALKSWLQTVKIKKWVYAAVDAEGPGPNGEHSYKLAEIYKGFDRVLNYSQFSANVTGYPDFLPHGIDISVFQPRDRKLARKGLITAGFGLKDDSFLIGIVGTNQTRKNWALGIQTAKILLDRRLDVRLWLHTDVIARHWDIGELIVDFGLQNRVLITNANFSDEQLSWFYSACNVTLGIGLGEGAGYPLFESTACGTPVVHGNYGGGPEYLTAESLVEPVAWRYEGIYCCKRPVFRPEDWADRVQAIAGTTPVVPEHIKWENAWKEWAKWLRNFKG